MRAGICWQSADDDCIEILVIHRACFGTPAKQPLVTLISGAGDAT
jgi:hypothetical protein